MARARESVRDAWHRADRRARGALRAATVLAMDGRPRVRDLPVGLRAREGAVSCARRFLFGVSHADSRPMPLRQHFACARLARFDARDPGTRVWLLVLHA